MAQVVAEATLQGESATAAAGELDLVIAVGVAGDATTAAEFEGAFVIDKSLVGEAAAGAGLTKVFKLIGASVVGQGDVGGLATSSIQAAVSGDAGVLALGDLILGGGTAVEGDAEMVGASELTIGGAAVVAGEATVAAPAKGFYNVLGTPSGDSALIAQALEDDEIASDVVGDANTASDASLIHGATAAATASTTITARAIVRPLVIGVPLPGVEVRADPTVERMVGFQPDREQPTIRERVDFARLSDEERIQQNREARRIRTVTRRDTGVSTTTYTRTLSGNPQGSDRGEP